VLLLSIERRNAKISFAKLGIVRNHLLNVERFSIRHGVPVGGMGVAGWFEAGLHG
jgi:hypothetical protein